MEEYLKKRMEKKRDEVKNISSKILSDYQVDGLEDIFKSIFNIIYNQNYKELAIVIKDIVPKYFKGNYVIQDIDDVIVSNIPQVQYALDIFYPGKLYYILPKRKPIDLLYYSNFIMVIFIINTFNGEDNSHEEVFKFSNRIMKLLYNFDKDVLFNNPDKEYFKNLNSLKWDKNAEKLFKSIYMVYEKYETTIITDMALEDSQKDYSAMEMGIFTGGVKAFLIFLAGCSAVNNDCLFIGFDEVVCSFKTFFKVLNTLGKNEVI